jgi:hypothetical protein
MANQSQTVHLPPLPTDAIVEAPAREEAPPMRPDPDESARMEEALATDAEGVFSGFRLALAICLTFWAALAASIAWLL